MRMHAFLILCMSLFFPLNLLAQTSETTQPTELQNTVPTSALVEILTSARDITQLPLNEPVELDMSLLNVPGGTGDLAQGVVVKAYARAVDVDGQQIGQLVLTGVAKGDKIEALNSSVFTAQFDLAKSQLNPDEPIMVMGNGPELIEALKRLQVEPKAEEKGDQDQQFAQSSSPEGAASGDTGNEDAAAYKSPEPVTASADAIETSSITTEGCSIRVDLAQGEAFVQSKTQDFKDGGMTGESACTDSEVSYKVQKSYANCTGQDIIDLEAKSATAQYQNYYVDGGGTNQTEGDCQPDPELKFDIVEKHGACMIYLDYSTNKAVFQSTLIYMNQNNVETQVASCAASVEKPAVPMTQTTQGCSIRHDFGSNKSFSQSVWTYQDNGTTYQAGSCVDDGTEYAHVKAYKDDAGDYLCSPINNAATVTLQSRVKITVDGLSQFVTECTPDTNTLAVSSTTEGCTNPALWNHDLAAAQSFGQERFYFMDGADKHYVNEACQTSTTTYAHQIETTGWQAHDDQLFSYPYTTVYITPPSGRYNIKTSEVLQGAQQMPYEFQKFDSVASGTAIYEGCNKLQAYDSVKVWKRPDDSYHNDVIGQGSPTSSNVCNTVGGLATTDWVLTNTGALSRGLSASCIHYSQGDQGQGPCDQWRWNTSTSRTCTYSTTVNQIRDDQEVVSSQSYEETVSRTTSGSSSGNGYCGGASSSWSCLASYFGVAGDVQCEANPTSPEVAAWRSKYGY